MARAAVLEIRSLARKNLFEPRQIFSRRRLLSQFLPLRRQPGSYQEPLNKAHMSKRHFKGLEADRVEALDHQIDDFAVARDIVQANKFGSDLKNFSTSTSMFLFVPEDGRSIGETQR